MYNGTESWLSNSISDTEYLPDKLMFIEMTEVKTREEEGYLLQ